MTALQDIQVDYEDLLGIRYQLGGRTPEEGMDCLGIVLEIYKRAGITLVDPFNVGARIIDFASLFTSVVGDLQPFDIAYLKRLVDGVYVCVRHGVFLSARPYVGVHTQRESVLRRVQDVEYFRLL